MAKKISDEQARAHAQEGIQLLQRTATREVSFKSGGKTYKVPGAKLNYGLVKNLKLQNEAQLAELYSNLWEKKVAEQEGLEAIIDELDWEEYDALFNEWMAPINDNFEELEKKYS